MCLRRGQRQLRVNGIQKLFWRHHFTRRLPENRRLVSYPVRLCTPGVSVCFHHWHVTQRQHPRLSSSGGIFFPLAPHPFHGALLTSGSTLRPAVATKKTPAHKLTPTAASCGIRATSRCRSCSSLSPRKIQPARAAVAAKST